MDTIAMDNYPFIAGGADQAGGHDSPAGLGFQWG